MKTLVKFFTILAIITSFAGGVSAAQQEFYDGNGNKVTIRDTWTQKSAQAQASWVDTAQQTFLPDFVVGGGVGYANGFRLLNGYETGIRFDNNCSVWASADIEWVGSNGNTFGAKLQPFLSTKEVFDALGVTSVMTPFGGSELVITLPQTAIKTGWIEVLIETVNGKPCITVSAVFRHKINGVIDGQAPVFPMAATTGFSLHVRRTSPPLYDSVESGLALANPDSVARPTPLFRTALITLSLRDGNGYPVGMPTAFPLAAGQQTAKFLSEFFPTVPANFEGTIEVSSNIPIVGVGLENSGFNFSTNAIGPARPIN